MYTYSLDRLSIIGHFLRIHWLIASIRWIFVLHQELAVEECPLSAIDSIYDISNRFHKKAGNVF